MSRYRLRLPLPNRSKIITDVKNVMATWDILRNCLVICLHFIFQPADVELDQDRRSVSPPMNSNSTIGSLFMRFQGSGADIRRTFYQPGGRFASHLQRTDNGQAGKVIHLKQPHFLS